MKQEMIEHYKHIISELKAYKGEYKIYALKAAIELEKLILHLKKKQ